MLTITKAFYKMQNLQSENVRTYLLDLQDSISLAIETEDGLARFSEDSWLREEGGGGQSRLLNEGDVFEKAGINFSDIEGSSLPDSATAKRPHLAGAHFRAWPPSCYPPRGRRSKLRH